MPKFILNTRRPVPMFSASSPASGNSLWWPRMPDMTLQIAALSDDYKDSGPWKGVRRD